MPVLWGVDTPGGDSLSVLPAGSVKNAVVTNDQDQRRAGTLQWDDSLGV
jgi:hypothetical protein